MFASILQELTTARKALVNEIAQLHQAVRTTNKDFGPLTRIDAASGDGQAYTGTLIGDGRRASHSDRVLKIIQPQHR